MVLEGDLTEIEQTLAAIDTASEPCLTLRQKVPHLAFLRGVRHDAESVPPAWSSTCICSTVEITV